MALSRALVDREKDKFIEGTGGETLVGVTGIATDPLPVSLTPAVVAPDIFNVTLATANTEISQALSANVKKFTIKNRGGAEIKLAFTATESGTTYITIPRGATYSEDNINSTVTLYMQSSKANQIVEIVEWA